MFCSFSKCVCVNAIDFVPVGTNTQCVEKDLNKDLEMNDFSKVHASLPNTQFIKTHLNVPHSESNQNAVYAEITNAYESS